MSGADAEIVARPVGEIAAAVRHGEVTATEVTRAYLAQIDAVEPRVRAYLQVTRERALAEAAAVDAARARGEPPGPLAGVPYGLKDSLVCAEVPATAGSAMLAGWVPPYEGAHVRRLRRAGAVLLGKLTLDEFGMGSSGEGTPWTPARNPWALEWVPGGSSSGSAAAVAARLAAFSLGTDTGGSIRQPAALCGLVGVKPTWGRVSRAGLIALASSLDTVGPLAREVDGAARVLACLAGQDPEDSTSLPDPVPDYAAAAARGAAEGLAGVRVGVDRGLLARAELDAEVADAFAAALAVLVDAGAELVEVALPHFDEALGAYYALSSAEAASNLARYDGARYGLSVPGDSYEAASAATRAAGFGAAVQRRILLGTLIQRAPELWARARRAQARIVRDHDEALARCEVLASPTTRLPGFRFGERAFDPAAMALSDRFVLAANLAGLPAMSLPAGFTRAREGRPRLPIGLHLVAPRLAEARLFAVAGAHEAATTWHAEVAPGAVP